MSHEALQNQGSVTNMCPVNSNAKVEENRRPWRRTFSLLAWLLGTSLAIYLLYWASVGVLAISHRYQPVLATLTTQGNCGVGPWPDKLYLLTWNIGYAGTGAEDDFFLAGGQNVLAKDKESVSHHLRNIEDVLRQNPADIYLLEEVDFNSRRTYNLDERKAIATSLGNYCSTFSLNHNVYFIPYPKLMPLGRVRSGMLELGRFTPKEAARHQLQGSFPWPDRAFQMERCLQVWKLPRSDGSHWTIIQLHLEAWDTGNIREAELKQLRDLALREFSEGAYVVIGGDWNAVLPGVRLDEFTKPKPDSKTMQLNSDFMPEGWTWGLDRSKPTNRSVEGPYDPRKNYLTIIDGFLVSPNVRIDMVKTLPLDFRDSDHEPVLLEVGVR